MKPLRIALITHGWPLHKFGGVGLYVSALANALHEEGHDITVLAPQKGTYYKLEHQKKTWGELILVTLPIAKNWNETWRRQESKLQFLLEHLVFDVVHVHHLGGWPLNLTDYIHNKSLVITLHDYAIICGRGQLYHPKEGICNGPKAEKCTSCLRAQIAHTPALQIVQQFLSRFQIQFILNQKQNFKNIVARFPFSKRHVFAMQNRLKQAKKTLNKADVLLSPSSDLMERTQPIINRNITRHQLPLLAKFPHTPLPPMPYRFIFASSLIPTKGLHRILDAMQKIENAELWVSGGGYDVDGWPNYLDDQLKRIQASPNCTYLGILEHKKVSSILSQCHCLILPSLWPENSPIIVREALSMGLEVICSKEGGAKELSDHIHVIEQKDSLVDAMYYVMKNPKRNPTHTFPTIKEHAQSLLSLYGWSNF